MCIRDSDETVHALGVDRMNGPSDWRSARALLFAGATLMTVVFTSACRESSGNHGALVVAGGDAGRGKTAIAVYGCGSCHTIPGIRTAKGTVGPPLFF